MVFIASGEQVSSLDFTDALFGTSFTGWSLNKKSNKRISASKGVFTPRIKRNLDQWMLCLDFVTDQGEYIIMKSITDTYSRVDVIFKGDLDSHKNFQLQITILVIVSFKEVLPLEQTCQTLLHESSTNIDIFESYFDHKLDYFIALLL